MSISTNAKEESTLIPLVGILGYGALGAYALSRSVNGSGFIDDQVMPIVLVGCSIIFAGNVYFLLKRL